MTEEETIIAEKKMSDERKKTAELLVEERRKSWFLAFGRDSFHFPKDVLDLLAREGAYGKSFGGKMILNFHQGYSEQIVAEIIDKYPLPYKLRMIEINFDVPRRVKQ